LKLWCSLYRDHLPEDQIEKNLKDIKKTLDDLKVKGAGSNSSYPESYEAIKLIIHTLNEETNGLLMAEYDIKKSYKPSEKSLDAIVIIKLMNLII